MSKSNKAATAAKVANVTKAAANNAAAAYYGIVCGKKAAKIGEKVETYLNNALAAAAAANAETTIQTSYSTIAKEFALWNDATATVSAASLDLYAIFQAACYRIAKQRKENNAARIPLLKTTKDNAAAAIFCTVETAYFDTYYAANEKAAAAAEKAAETKAANKAKAAAEKETAEKAAEKVEKVDTAEKATAAILTLIAAYGGKLDTAAIIAAAEKAAAKAAEKATA